MSEPFELQSLDFDVLGGDNGSSSAFGGGIELLMNDRGKRAQSGSGGSGFGGGGNSGFGGGGFELDDLSKLEKDMNDLDPLPSTFFGTSSSSSAPPGDRTDSAFGPPPLPASVSFQEHPQVHLLSDPLPEVGEGTAQSYSNTKTWDGYGSFNDIPVQPDHPPPAPSVSREELFREKRELLLVLDKMESKGCTLTKRFTMESDLWEMRAEVEVLRNQRKKHNGVQFQRKSLLMAVQGLEWMNSTFDPFDVDLDGFGDAVNENVEEFDDIFEELYEKYKTNTLMPEIRLAWTLGSIGAMTHFSNRMMRGALPGTDDILRQNPDLMHAFQSAAVNTMSQTHPGLTHFMTSASPSLAPSASAPASTSASANPFPLPPSTDYVARETPTVRPGPGPPPPIATQGGMSSAGRGGNNPLADVPPPGSRRPDMRGPGSLTELLAPSTGVRPRAVDLGLATHLPSVTGRPTTPTLSVASGDDLHSVHTDGPSAKRPRRRREAKDNNTISLSL
jgi:hypothetical protein